MRRPDQRYGFSPGARRSSCVPSVDHGLISISTHAIRRPCRPSSRAWARQTPSADRLPQPRSGRKRRNLPRRDCCRAGDRPAPFSSRYATPLAFARPRGAARRRAASADAAEWATEDERRRRAAELRPRRADRGSRHAPAEEEFQDAQPLPVGIPRLWLDACRSRRQYAHSLTPPVRETR
jgi:hypothetical protein